MTQTLKQQIKEIKNSIDINQNERLDSLEYRIKNIESYISENMGETANVLSKLFDVSDDYEKELKKIKGVKKVGIKSTAILAVVKTIASKYADLDGDGDIDLEDLEVLKNVLDINKDGKISLSEVKSGFKLQSADINGDGNVTKGEQLTHDFYNRLVEKMQKNSLWTILIMAGFSILSVSFAIFL